MKELLKPILCLILSLLFLPYAATYIDKVEVVNNGLETTALVTKMHSGRAGYLADVQYIVDNNRYVSSMRVKGKNVNVGDIVTILYLPEHPDQITLKNRNHASDKLSDLLVVSFPAVLLFFYGVISIILKVIRKS
ncbi:hypothetical protein C4J81_11075 [Deltaproteobacteria bacterium Smac51]|nr:hypothetical protein C4J81_11075 [Deltaproteobacteria bacterium Smac51]